MEGILKKTELNQKILLLGPLHQIRKYYLQDLCAKIGKILKELEQTEKYFGQLTSKEIIAEIIYHIIL